MNYNEEAHERKMNALDDDLVKYDLKIERMKNKLSYNRVDELLDEYNDYMKLFNQFGDNLYKLKAEHTLQSLKNINNK